MDESRRVQIESAAWERKLGADDDSFVEGVERRLDVT